MTDHIEEPTALERFEAALLDGTVFGVEPASMHRLHLQYHSVQIILEALRSERKEREEGEAVDVPDIKLVIADYLERRDAETGVNSTDEERSASAIELHDAIQTIHAKLASPAVTVGVKPEDEKLCTDRAMMQWEISLARPDLSERDRVRGAIEAYARQAFALSLPLTSPPGETAQVEAVLSVEAFAFTVANRVAAGVFEFGPVRSGLTEDQAAAFHGHVQDCVTDAFRALYVPPALSAKESPEQLRATHRHKKRGSEYVLIGYGKMQAENWRERRTSSKGDQPRVDMREVAIYRSIEDGSLWARPREEFDDGRFEPLSNSSMGERT